MRRFEEAAEREASKRGVIKILLINSPLDFYSDDEAPKYRHHLALRPALALRSGP